MKRFLVFTLLALFLGGSASVTLAAGPSWRNFTVLNVNTPRYQVQSSTA